MSNQLGASPGGVQLTSSATGDANTGRFEQYKSIGINLLSGINPNLVQHIWQNFSHVPGGTAAPADWVNAMAAGGTVSNVVNGKQALSRLATNAGANARADQNTVPYLGHQGTGRWYYAAKFSIPTIVDAETKILHAIATSGGNTVGFGVLGPVSAVNFIAYRDGTFAAGTSIGSLAPVDNAEHIGEMWCNADSRLYARLDGGSIISAVQTAAAANMSLYHICRNGAAGGDRQHDRRWSLLIWEEI